MQKVRNDGTISQEGNGAVWEGDEWVREMETVHCLRVIWLVLCLPICSSGVLSAAVIYTVFARPYASYSYGTLTKRAS